MPVENLRIPMVPIGTQWYQFQMVPSEVGYHLPINKVLGTATNGRSLRSVNIQNILGTE